MIPLLFRAAAYFMGFESGDYEKGPKVEHPLENCIDALAYVQEQTEKFKGEQDPYRRELNMYVEAAGDRLNCDTFKPFREVSTIVGDTGYHDGWTFSDFEQSPFLWTIDQWGRTGMAVCYCSKPDQSSAWNSDPDCGAAGFFVRHESQRGHMSVGAHHRPKRNPIFKIGPAGEQLDTFEQVLRNTHTDVFLCPLPD